MILNYNYIKYPQLVLSALIFLFCGNIFSQKIIIDKSDSDKIQLKFDFSNSFNIIKSNNSIYSKIKTDFNYIRTSGEPDLAYYTYFLKCKRHSKYKYKILDEINKDILNIRIVPFSDSLIEYRNLSTLDFNQNIYSSNEYFPIKKIELLKIIETVDSVILPIRINFLRYNPVKNIINYNSKITIEISPEDNSGSRFDIQEENISTSNQQEGFSWYDSAKTYYKIFTSKPDLYRVSFDELNQIKLFPANSLDDLELINYGELVPIEIYDNNSDSIFNSGDYFEFIGTDPKPSLYTNKNIYNIKNIYWFTLNSLATPIRYIKNDVSSGPINSIISESNKTLLLEEDKIYERLGFAQNGNRDHWYWGKVSYQSGPGNVFNYTYTINDSVVNSDSVHLEIAFHGVTSLPCQDDHNINIKLNDIVLGNAVWDGQKEYIFKYSFINAQNGLDINGINNFRIEASGSNCSSEGLDEVRVNWIKYNYKIINKADSSLVFRAENAPNGLIKYNIRNWNFPKVKIFNPSQKKIISNVNYLNDSLNTISFVDSGYEGNSNYFIFDSSYASQVDGIILDSATSLRQSHRADYIIITHKDFLTAANRLAEYRRTNLANYTDPKVKVVVVDDIYDEFSYGLTSPFSIRDYIKFVFNNSIGNAPKYLVLMGDMSYDYRALLPNSRPNFIPSYPYHAINYGEAASDNYFAAVLGDDVIPEMAVGRLSCETIDEANILVDKIINYKSAPQKEWKENVLLIGAGLNEQDEKLFQFNNTSLGLEEDYIKPVGYKTKKIFRYPNDPNQQQYKGGQIEIREAYNEGTVLSNFYGHGGGFQWDLVFLDDDIYLLENDFRLPIVLSVTCFTAHFDNQDVFGEIFNKVENKGSIGFWGNTGLTYYTVGTIINGILFDEIFNKKEFVIGDAILNSKIKLGGISSTIVAKDNIALLTYLGDPAVKILLPEKPDFLVQSDDVSIFPEYPVINDSIEIVLHVNNVGRIFNDTLSTTMKIVHSNLTDSLIEKKIAPFSNIDSVTFNYLPKVDGEFEFIFNVNQNGKVLEDDLSDNIVSKKINVYSLDEPKIVKPINGYVFNKPPIEFIFSDIGSYTDLTLQYEIEIDTTMSFSAPIKSIKNLLPVDGKVSWKEIGISEGRYFWKARIVQDAQFSSWSAIQSFSFTNMDSNLISFSKEQLQQFQINNFIYDHTSKSLKQNKNLHAPKPTTVRVEDTLYIATPDTNYYITSMTTDGDYIYYSQQSDNSQIHKIGTGNNSVKGQYYGTIPLFNEKISGQLFFFSNSIYLSKGNAHNITKVNPQSGVTSVENVPPGFLNLETGKIEDGKFLLSADDKYVYNIAHQDSLGNQKITIRIFDPNNNWSLVSNDVLSSSSNMLRHIVSFFVADDFIYPYENYYSGFMRKIRSVDGYFEEEWLTNETIEGYQGYYSWCYDRINDKVYASNYRLGLPSRIVEFSGKYNNGSGSVISNTIGPSKDWSNLKVNVNNQNYAGTYTIFLEGKNSSTNAWDSLNIIDTNVVNISNINSILYPYLRTKLIYNDETSGIGSPLEYFGLSANYTPYGEIIILPSTYIIRKDTVVSGDNNTLTFSVQNIGYSKIDSLILNVDEKYSEMNLYSDLVLDVNPDSIIDFNYLIPTISLNGPASLRTILTTQNDDVYEFNNVKGDVFTIISDTLAPTVKILFDGYEIFQNDFVNTSPIINIEINDNSSHSIDTSLIKLYLDGKRLNTSNDKLNFKIDDIIKSKIGISFQPTLQPGKHFLSVISSDASGNMIDSGDVRVDFQISDNSILQEVYNYPNPFEDHTYFYFNLISPTLPISQKIKIFTISGRLIAEINNEESNLKIGYNRLLWDGKDQDGDRIANGVYFVKIITEFLDSIDYKTIKVAKIN